MPTLFPFGAINVSTGGYEPPFAGVKNQKYKCPECEFKVKWTCGYTKSNGTTVLPYFSHFPGYSCDFYDTPSESFNHKEAKRQVSWCVNNKRPLTITRRCIECRADDPVYVTDADNTAIEECRFDPDNLLLRADVAILKDGKPVFLIEICATHKTEDRPEPWSELYAGSTLGALAKGNYSLCCVRNMRHQCAPCIERKKKEEEEKILKEKALKEQAEERRKQKEKEAAMREKERVLRIQKEKEEQLQLERDLEERKIKYLESKKQQAIADASRIAAYHASLSPQERCMHEAAASVMKTRYDTIYCSGFIEWEQTQKK